MKLDKEFFFVKLPILFPLIYGFILFFAPSLETSLIFLTILLMAEPHFGATWPFFLDKTNHEHIIKNKITLLFIPLIIIILCLLGFFLINKIFLLIFFAANIFHVTRQSIGVCKLYSKDEATIRFQEIYLYLFNGIFFLIAYLKFFLEINIEEIKLFLNLIIITLIILSIIIFIYKFKFNENLLTYITGILIFSPVCFVNNPVHVILMGVTMHFSQYLYLTNKVFNGRKLKRENTINKNNYLNYFIITVAVYGIFMALMSMTGGSSYDPVKKLIIIPIIGQMLHFYLDSQLWKFSVRHNRENVLKFIV